MEFFTHCLLEIIAAITLKSLMISLIIVFIGGLIQGYTGFGGGTISVPILVLLFGPIAAIGIITPIYIFGALVILPKTIKNVNWSEVLPVSIAGSIAVVVVLSILVNTKMEYQAFNEKYIVVMHHPETTKVNETYNQILQTINAVLKLKDIKVVWLWPNIDAGSDIISKQLRILRENKLMTNISFFKNFSPEEYIKLIYNSEC